MDLIIQCITKNYANFSNRARRKEYWPFILSYTALNVVLILIDVSVGTFHTEIGYGALSGIFALAMACPTISVTVRRLHDTDRSGWWILIGLIPIVGYIWLIVLLCFKGTEGANRFGANPLLR